MTAKEDAAREAAVFDGMLPGWHKHYASGSVVLDEYRQSLWHILLLRREPELVEHLAREVISRLLSDDFNKTMQKAGHVASYRRTANGQQEVSYNEKD